MSLLVPEYYIFMALLPPMAYVKKYVIKEDWMMDPLTETTAFSKNMSHD